MLLYYLYCCEAFTKLGGLIHIHRHSYSIYTSTYVQLPDVHI